MSAASPLPAPNTPRRPGAAETAARSPRGPREQRGRARAAAPSLPPARRAARPQSAAADHLPGRLPVSGRRHEIAEALRRHQVIIVSGETGSGKTTQLPKICLELGRGEKGLIGHTQPRRIAASSTAKRIAQELGSPLGELVGFKVRFADTLSKGAWSS
jgi:ATP-dependent helicase HrpA